MAFNVGIGERVLGDGVVGGKNYGIFSSKCVHYDFSKKSFYSWGLARSLLMICVVFLGGLISRLAALRERGISLMAPYCRYVGAYKEDGRFWLLGLLIVMSGISI